MFATSSRLYCLANFSTALYVFTPKSVFSYTTVILAVGTAFTPSRNCIMFSTKVSSLGEVRKNHL